MALDGVFDRAVCRGRRRINSRCGSHFMVTALSPGGPSRANKVLAGPNLNRQSSSGYAEIGKNSEGGETCAWRTLQRGRWSLAKYRPVGSSESSEFREAKTVGNLCYVRGVGIGVP